MNQKIQASRKFGPCVPFAVIKRSMTKLARKLLDHAPKGSLVSRPRRAVRMLDDGSTVATVWRELQ